MVTWLHCFWVCSEHHGVTEHYAGRKWSSLCLAGEVGSGRRWHWASHPQSWDFILKIAWPLSLSFPSEGGNDEDLLQGCLGWSRAQLPRTKEIPAPRKHPVPIFNCLVGRTKGSTLVILTWLQKQVLVKFWSSEDVKNYVISQPSESSV